MKDFGHVYDAWRSDMKRIIFFLIPLILGTHTILSARSYEVPSDFKTIQAALDGSGDHDTIYVKQGIYYENIIWPKTRGIQLIGENNSTTIINGSQKGSVILFDESIKGFIDHDTRISGFSLVNGKADAHAFYRGGGIHCSFASPIIDNMVIKENYAEHGGGIYCLKSDMKIEQAAIIYNHVNSSGAGIYAGDSQLELLNVSLMFNNGNSGTAIFYQKSTLRLSQTILIENNAIKKNPTSSALLSYHSNTNIIHSVIWNADLSNEIVFSEYSDTNALTISYTNIRDNIDKIKKNKGSQINCGKGIFSERPKPFDLNLDPRDDTGISCTDNITRKTKQLRIHGFGRYKNNIILFVNDNEQPNTQPVFTGEQFQFTIDLPEGHHKLNATILNHEPSPFGVSNPLEITIDHLRPVITDISGTQVPVAIQTWNFSVVGQESNVRFRFLVDQQSDTIPDGKYTHTNRIQLGKENYADGVWFLHLQACDAAGNESDVRTFKTILDNTKPIICGLFDHLTPTTSKTWTWTAKDADSKILFRHSIDMHPDSRPDGAFNTVNKASVENIAGKAYLHVQAKDQAGNISDVVTVFVHMDNLPPEIIGLENDDHPRKFKTWLWQSSSPTSVEYRFVVNQQKSSIINGAYHHINTTGIKEKDGLWYIHVQARDKNGSTGKIKTAYAVLDNTPPIVLGLCDDYTPTKSKKWQWYTQDREEITFRYLIDQKAYSEPDNAFTGVTSAQLSDVNGIWTIHVQAKDRAGNVSDIAHVSAILDNKKPEIKGLSNFVIPQKNISWSWSAEDADPQMRFRWLIDQNAKAQLTGAYTTTNKTSISDGDGIRYLHVQAIDRAGNASSIYTASGILDNTPPELKILDLDNDPQIVSKKKWQWKGDDADSHIVYRYILTKKMNPHNFGSFSPKTSVTIFDETDEIFLHLQAKDRAGNLSKIISVSKLLDNTPPVIKGLQNDLMPKKKKEWAWHSEPLDDKVLYQYSINQQEDAAPFGPFRSNSKALIDGVDGKWYLHVIAKDLAGNLSEKVTVSAILDNTPPKISGLVDNLYPAQSKQLTWTTQDNDPYILHRYQIDQFSDASPTSSFTHVNSVKISDLNGSHYFHVQAKDRAGNISETVTVMCVFDNLAPVLTHLANIEIPSQSVDWTWQAKDADKNLRFRYELSQSPATELYNDFTKNTHVRISELNGRWYLNVQAKDRAGNLSDIKTVWAEFDNICPRIEGISDDPKPVQSKHWQWHAIDTDHNINYQFMIDQNLNSQPSRAAFNPITQTSLTNCDGKWYLHVQAKDSAGNMSPVKTVYAVLDNTSPEMTGLSSYTKPVKQAQFIWSAHDTDPFVCYRYVIDLNKQTIPPGQFYNSNQAQITSGNGIYYLHVQAQDRALNISNVATVSVLLDNQPPMITNLSNDDTPVQLKKWQWQSYDDDTHIFYRWCVDQQADSKPTGSYTHVNETTLTDENGRWYIHVQAKDRAGNISNVKSVSAILDSIPPMVNGLIDDPSPKQSVKWHWQAKDQDSHLTYRYHVDQEPDTVPKKPFQSVTEYGLSGVNGQFYIHVQAKDRAGNLSPVVKAYAILDNIAPVITGLSSDHNPVKAKNWTWLAQDADRDISYRYTINQSSVASFNSTFTNKTNARIKDVDGLWYLHIQAKDRAGNVSEIYSVSAILDNKPPVFEQMIDDIIPQSTKKWEWHAKDNDSQIRYRFVIDQKPVSIPTGEFTNVKQTVLSQKKGKWYLHIQAKDRAGNISQVKTVFAQMTTGKEGLFFDINVNFFSSTIKPINTNGIRSLGNILQTYPTTYAIIKAHTDNTGDANNNIVLSQKRADFVRQLLINQYKISADRIKSFGYGATLPVADNSTPEGKLKNRRAEAWISYQKIDE